MKNKIIESHNDGKSTEVSCSCTMLYECDYCKQNETATDNQADRDDLMCAGLVSILEV